MSLIDQLLTRPPEDAIREAEAAQAEFFRQSLYLTAKILLGYKDLTWNTHGPIVSALEAPTIRKLIVMPRGSFKSSLTSVSYAIWLLLRDPNLRILIDSELYTNSKNFLREIKGHLESEKLVRLFGRFRSTTWNEGEIIIAQRNRNLKEASITCTGIGAEKTGQHYDVILMDDMNSPSNSNTPEGCQKVIDHYKYNNALLDPGGTLVLVGTRYSQGDNIGFCLDNEILPQIDT